MLFITNTIIRNRIFSKFMNMFFKNNLLSIYNTKINSIIITNFGTRNFELFYLDLNMQRLDNDENLGCFYSKTL